MPLEWVLVGTAMPTRGGSSKSQIPSSKKAPRNKVRSKQTPGSPTGGAAQRAGGDRSRVRISVFWMGSVRLWRAEPGVPPGSSGTDFPSRAALRRTRRNENSPRRSRRDAETHTRDACAPHPKKLRCALRTGTGDLELGFSLELGFWLLELLQKLSCGRAARTPAGQDHFKMRPPFIRGLPRTSPAATVGS